MSILTRDYAPEGMSESEKESLLSMDLTQDFRTIAKNLDNFHAIFQQLWQLGHPVLTFEIQTAAVSFDREGNQVLFLFNPLFWKELDEYSREFIICHECLHVILNHGLRNLEVRGRFLHELSNKAMDVVVNHMLIDKFNFDRYSIQNQGSWCWIDTCFGKEHKLIEKNRCFEYYYGILKKNAKESLDGLKCILYRNSDGSYSGTGEALDSHDFLQDLQEAIQEILEKHLTDEDKKDLINKMENSEAGSDLVGKLMKISKRRFKKNRKWETVIKRWSMKFLTSDHDVEQWSKKTRRMYSLDNDILLPCEIEEEKFAQDKINVWFFLDASGSCVHLKDRFFGAAKSLPEDRFIIHCYSFDTAVYKIDLNTLEIEGGGGTSFSILEEEIQKYLKKDPTREYPEAIFVITDGYGTVISPEKPKRWYFFLSENYRDCIPKTCNIYKLKDFE